MTFITAIIQGHYRTRIKTPLITTTQHLPRPILRGKGTMLRSNAIRTTGLIGTTSSILLPTNRVTTTPIRGHRTVTIARVTLRDLEVTRVLEVTLDPEERSLPIPRRADPVVEDQGGNDNAQFHV